MNKPIVGQKLSAGIIGAGEVVSKAHLPVLLAMEDISVAWVADQDERRAKQLSDSYKVKWLPLPKQLSGLPHTDIVLLAVPYGARPPYYEVLRDRGSALYVEKPISRSADELRRLCALFSPWSLGIGLQRRSWGQVQLLKQLVQTSVFGRLNRIEFRFGGSAIVTSGKSFVSDTKLAGGGILFEHGIHGLDLALYIAGANSAHSYKVKTIIDKGFDVHSQGQVSLKSAAGEFVLDFKISWISEMQEGLLFVFDQACVDMSVVQPRLLLKTKQGKTVISLLEPGSIYPLTGFQTLWQYWRDFLAGVRTKTVNYTSASSAILTTDLLEQIYARGVIE